MNLDGAVWRFSNEGNRGAFAKNPRSMDRVSAAMTRSPSAAAGPFRASPDLDGRRATALPFLQRADARFFPRRSGPHHRYRGAQMAGGAELGQAVGLSGSTAADLVASPQAIKAGTRKFSAARPYSKAGPAESSRRHRRQRPAPDRRPHPTRRLSPGADRCRRRLRRPGKT